MSRVRAALLALSVAVLTVGSPGCVCLLNSTAGGGCEPGCYWMLGGFPVDGCGTMGGPGCPESLDAAIDGCFRHPDGTDLGRMRIALSSCNLVEGYGFGLEELAFGPPPHADWVFVGAVTQDGGLVDDEGNEILGAASLAVTGDAGEVTVIHERRADGVEWLALQTATPDGGVRRAELMRCATCPCEP